MNLTWVEPAATPVKFMPTSTEPTFTARIYLSGPIEVAKQLIRAHVMAEPLCVTVEPTTFIYTGGEEAGYVVGLLNYPRFPKSPDYVRQRAMLLAELLMTGTYQRSALVVTPTETHWIRTSERDTSTS